MTNEEIMFFMLIDCGLIFAYVRMYRKRKELFRDIMDSPLRIKLCIVALVGIILFAFIKQWFGW